MQIKAPFFSSRLFIPKNRRLFNPTLYLVANRPSFQDLNLFFARILAAVQGGVTCVQFRDHSSELSQTIKIARHLKSLLNGRVPLFINTLNLFDVALAVDADGVYLENTYSIVDARKVLGRKKIIGVPVKTMKEVEALEGVREVDYLSVKIDKSKKTCPHNDHLWHLEGLTRVCGATSHIVVAIGGQTLSTVEPVYRILRKGDGVAMAGGLMDEKAPQLTAEKIRILSQKIRDRK